MEKITRMCHVLSNRTSKPMWKYNWNFLGCGRFNNPTREMTSSPCSPRLFGVPLVQIATEDGQLPEPIQVCFLNLQFCQHKYLLLIFSAELDGTIK